MRQLFVSFSIPGVKRDQKKWNKRVNSLLRFFTLRPRGPIIISIQRFTLIPLYIILVLLLRNASIWAKYSGAYSSLCRPFTNGLILMDSTNPSEYTIDLHDSEYNGHFASYHYRIE